MFQLFTGDGVGTMEAGFEDELRKDCWVDLLGFRVFGGSCDDGAYACDGSYPQIVGSSVGDVLLICAR